MAELGSYNDEDHGQGYFQVLPTPPALLGALTILEECVALGRLLPQEFAASAEISALIASVQDQVNIAGQKTAQVAERLIAEKIAQTRVRPEVQGGRKHLEEAIKADSLGVGAVGIGSIQELDTVVGSDGKPFWRAQEYGSDHLVGRTIYGLFQPGGAIPSQDSFRQHPIFTVGEGGAMRIKRPIPARHFMRDGSAEALLFRERTFGEVQAVAVGEIRAIMSGLKLTL